VRVQRIFPFRTLIMSVQCLHIIQTHYPERLGRAHIINAPFWITAFYTLVSPFVDPTTRAKLCWNPQPVREGFVAADQLVSGWPEGKREFEYKHDQYWPELVQICKERRQKWLERWRELGGTVGTREWDYKQEA
jgi:hypothetical protein